MKPELLLLLACFGAASAATGAILAKGSAKPIENAYGNDGQLTYSMTLDSSSNALFGGGYGAGSASTATSSGQSSVGFASYVFNQGGISLESHKADAFTMKGCHNSLRTMIGSTGDGFYDIVSVTVTFTAEVPGTHGNFWAYASSEPITSLPQTDGSTVISNDKITIPFAGSEDHHFAIVFGGDSSHQGANYWVALSSIVIQYRC